MNWRLVQRLLSQAGYDMHWAEDGLKGFELALELKPALILLDINLPGLPRQQSHDRGGHAGVPPVEIRRHDVNIAYVHIHH